MKVLRLVVAGGLTTLLGVSLAVGLIEAGFRIHEHVYPPADKAFFWVPNPEYGWGLGAGRTGLFFNDQREFEVFVSINSKGLRDVERSYTKPPGAFRILVLGDSYIEALQVELAEAFTRRLEEELRAAGFNAVEVINSGVSSWGTDNQLLFLRAEGVKYAPDLVLLSFTTANDVRENFRAFNEMALGANLTKPHFSLTHEGRLLQHPPVFPPAEPVPWWRDGFRTGRYLYRRFGPPAVLPGRPNTGGVPPPSDPKIPYVPADILVYKPDPPPEVATAYEVTKALLLALRDEVRTMGATFAVMIHNAPWAHDERRWKFMCMRNPRARDTWDRQRPNRIIGEFLAQHDIPYFDLYETFDAAKQSQELFFQLDPHWRPAGHRIAATAAAQFLTKSGLIRE